MFATCVDPDHAAVLEHRQRFGFPTNVGACLGGTIDERSVEPAAGPHRSVVGEPGSRRPIEFAFGTVGDHPQAFDAVGVAVVDVERIERCDGTWGQAVATYLVSSIRRFVEDHDLGPAACRLHSGRGAGRAGSDHEKICMLHPTIVP